MYANGIFKVKQASSLSSGSTGFDSKGNPIAATAVWGRPIRCQIKTVTERKGVYEDGVFHQASYEVLCEISSSLYDTKRIFLERDGVELGEYEVQSIECSATMGRIKFTV